MYGSLVIAYLFLGGAAAGTLFVASAWSIAFGRAPQPARTREAFYLLRRRAYALGFILLALAMACLLWDLERPERALLLFVRPHATALTFGAYTLAVEATLAAVLFASCLLGKPALHGRMRTIAEVLCAAGALATMAYTGVFLMQNAPAIWHSGAIVGLFVFSSLSCGVSIVLLADWLAQGQTATLRAAKPLQRWHLACLAIEAAFLAAFTGAAFANPEAAASVAMLQSSAMLSVAIVGVCGFSIALPAVLETYSLARTDCRTIPVSDAVCLFGGLCLRYCVIACGTLAFPLS